MFGKGNINKKKSSPEKSSSLARLGIGKDKDYFIENFALLMSSGIDVISAVDSIKDEIRSSAMKKIITGFREDVEAGTPLAKALEDTKIFPDFVFSLIRIGEQSGKLPENLQLIVRQLKKDRTFRSKIQSAVMYPVFVLLLALFIGVGISWYILPKLANVFAQLKVDLPFVTKVLINFGLFMGKYGAVFVPVFLIGVVAIIYLFFFHPKTKFIGQKILFKTPGIKRLIREVEMARMGFVFGILLDAGVPIVESIRAVGSSTSMHDYRKFYAFLASEVETGHFLHESFNLYPASRQLVTRSAMQIISAGEKSGKLKESLRRIGDIYEEKTENTTKYLATMLEPLLLVVVWLGVVFVAMAVILPIYSLVGGFNTNNNAAAPPPPISAPPVIKDPTVDETVGDGPADKESEAGDPKNLIEIKKTETGFLNVRSGSAKTASVVGRVLPGEKFNFLEEKDGWLKIRFKKDSQDEGWILKDYTLTVADDAEPVPEN